MLQTGTMFQVEFFGFYLRVGGRVVECTGLENQRARKRSGGSNPSPPAINRLPCLGWFVYGDCGCDESARPARPGFENKLNKRSEFSDFDAGL